MATNKEVMDGLLQIANAINALATSVSESANRIVRLEETINNMRLHRDNTLQMVMDMRNQLSEVAGRVLTIQSVLSVVGYRQTEDGRAIQRMDDILSRGHATDDGEIRAQAMTNGVDAGLREVLERSGGIMNATILGASNHIATQSAQMPAVDVNRMYADIEAAGRTVAESIPQPNPDNRRIEPNL
jgi:outer membrane murein-binding lipoprotein Lpp